METKLSPWKDNPQDDVYNEDPANVIHEPLKTPSSLGEEYTIEDEIGHGAQGKIFRAIRKKDKQIVVIKQLRIDSIKTWKEYDLFHREAEVLGSINIHGVAKFYDAFECLNDNPPSSYIVQEYIPGASLQQMINDGHRFKTTEVYDILIQIISILNELHHHDPPVIHRDIKPSNIMITPNEFSSVNVTMIDFGAVANPQVQGGGSTVAGTFGYMPPEQLMGKPVPESDIYAAAVVAVQMFSGKLPADIPTKDFRLIFEPYMEDKPHELVTLLRKMLEPRIENRLADTDAIIKTLDDLKNNRVKDKDGIKIKRNNKAAFSDEYNKRLENIKFIGETGCVELWQGLPDEPDRGIPAPYVERLQAPIIIEQKCNLVDNHKRILFMAVFPILFFIAVLILLVSIVINHDTDLAVNVSIFAAVVLFLGAVFYFQSSREYELCPRSAHAKKWFLEPSDVKDYMYDLIMNGRKGMATIVAIEYLPMGDVTEIGSIDRCLAYGVPEFNVLYKFNPPDDRREEDIIHAFVTHVEPEGHYKVGDPLPILYRIDEGYFKDTVYSMPFPMPMDDLLYLGAVVDKSDSFVKKKITNLSSDNDYVCGFFASVDAAMSISEIDRAIRAFEINPYKPEELYLFYPIAPVLGEFLKDPAYSQCHDACIDKLTDLMFPIRSYKNNDSIGYASSFSTYIIDFLKAKPRLSSYPSLKAMQSVFMWLYRRKAYEYRSSDIPEGVWEALADVYVDVNVSTEVRALIAERYVNIAPKKYVDSFTQMIHDK